jgi:GNAT superfamily N-acetyltransferase
MLEVRPAHVADAAAWADVVQAASPSFVIDAASAAHEIATDGPPDSLSVVAVLDGTVVGVARQHRYRGEEHVGVLVMVRPDHRQQGVGTALMAWHHEHLRHSGRARATTVVEDDPGSRAAAARWGFAITRALRKAALELAELPPPGPTPPGVELLAVGEVGPDRIWSAHQQVARDDPSGLTRPTPYDDWVREEWDDPRFRSDLGRAVLVDGELAAYTLLGAAGQRAWSGMTGTLPQHRGHGLARLAKHHALHAAAGAGIVVALTGNDAANAPMLAVNRRLGYRPVDSPALAERSLAGTAAR